MAENVAGAALIADRLMHNPLLFAAAVLIVLSGVLIVSAVPSVVRGNDVMSIVIVALLLALTSTALSTVARMEGLWWS